MSIRNRIARGAAILLLSLGIACNASAGGGEQQVGDVGAGYALGVEDYSEAIRLHTEQVTRATCYIAHRLGREKEPYSCAAPLLETNPAQPLLYC